ncbi:MAG: hypothetical protein PVF20_09810, partial [Desulfobacterales bacterium]
MTLSYSPLTPACWVDFVSLFGDRGACGGCWCMLWRLDRRRFESQKGEGNRRAMKAIVDSGEIPGILAYRGGRAVGWCAVSPRKTYSALSRSRILRPVDDREVWSIACLFIEKSHRNKGVSVDLLSAGAAFAASRG